MNVSDWLIITATLAGPTLAVQAQKFVERATESRRRKQWIFDTIMANRATRLADENVKALNLIDLEFRRGIIRYMVTVNRAHKGSKLTPARQAADEVGNPNK